MSKNETQKTGIFGGVAAITALIAAVVAWPTSSKDERSYSLGMIDKPLFEKFTDPLAAASLKITTFNEEQATLRDFEVRKDQASGLWTIPSRDGYPADAVAQMKDAASAFVGLKALDAPPANPEDFAGFGVLEPNADTLEGGDEGVGRLVELRDGKGEELAKLIIGKEVPDQPGQVYVRKPSQDAVYTVKLDDTPLNTNFQDWIEEDLLQLSSIDIDSLTLKEYSANLSIDGRVSWNRKFDAEFDKDGTKWELAAIKEYNDKDPLAPPVPVEIDAEKELNTTKLNDLGNALDDLKFVDVKRKPEGISADLKADKEFASNQKAANELVSKGFIPIPLGPDGEIEIISANGELTTTLKSGVKYILRFGNIAGVSKGSSDDESAEGDDTSEEKEDEGGVNRYLMVSTVVDESMFPPPELEKYPNDLAELEAMEKAKKPDAPDEKDLPPELNQPEQNDPEMKKDDAGSEDAESNEKESTEEKPGDEKAASDEKTGEEKGGDVKVDEDAKSTEGKSEDAKSEENKDEKADDDQPSSEDSNGESESETAESNESEEKADTGEVENEGTEEATTVGEGQEQGDQDESAKDAENSNEADAKDADVADEKQSEESDDEKPAEEAAQNENASDSKPDETKPAAPETPEETEEEKQERLAAVQERIMKENERKIEERKEKLAEAKKLSRELNERFADWYYVIPEATYSKLRIDRDSIFKKEGDAAPTPPTGLPNFGAPPSFPIPGAGN